MNFLNSVPPISWELAKLKQFSHVELGQSPPSETYNSKADGLPFFQGKAEFGVDVPTVRKWCSVPKKIAEKGDVLISVRAPVGPTNFAVEKSAIGRGLAAIRPYSSISSSKYVRFFFQLIEPQLSREGSGSTFSAISGNFLKDVEIPIAPLSEQRRIVSKIEELFSDLDAGEAALRKAQRLIEMYRQSVLKAAVTGELTREWREKNGTRIEACELGKYVRVQGGYAFKSTDYIQQGVPLIRISNLTNRDVQITENTVFLPETYLAENPSFKLKKGDVLIAMSGATTGKMGVYDLETPALLNQRVGRFIARDSEKLNSDYVRLLVMSLGPEILRQAYGGAQPNISSGKIESLITPIAAHIEEQAEIVARVEQLFVSLYQMTQTLNSGFKYLATLRQSILKQAFEGKLVPQDPADEPASELLKRISAQSPQPNATRGRKKKAAA